MELYLRRLDGRAGQICAAKTMALANVMCFEHPEVVEQARQEWKEKTGGTYHCPVEPGKKPVIP